MPQLSLQDRAARSHLGHRGRKDPVEEDPKDKDKDKGEPSWAKGSNVPRAGVTQGYERPGVTDQRSVARLVADSNGLNWDRGDGIRNKLTNGQIWIILCFH